MVIGDGPRNGCGWERRRRILRRSRRRTIARLERAIDGVDKARDLLVGSFDIYLGRSAQRSNDVMKTLTLVYAIAPPAIVLAGIMGMNFQLPFFERPENFWVVIGAMVLLAVGILVFSAGEAGSDRRPLRAPRP
jgi:magnesium transporter